MKKFTVVLENWDGRCKRVTVSALNESDAFAIAQVKYKTWTPVEVIAN